MKLLLSFSLFLIAGCSNPTSTTSDLSGITGTGSDTGTTQNLPDVF